MSVETVPQRIRHEFKWDCNLDYEKTYADLQKRIEEYVRPGLLQTQRQNLLYTLVALIQLTNGCRISEACEYANTWLATGKLEQRIRVRKQSKPLKERVTIVENGERREVLQNVLDRAGNKVYSESNQRLMVFPSAFESKSEELRTVLKGLQVKPQNAKVFDKRMLGFNSHGLRYCALTRFANRFGPTGAAALSGHKELNFILRYFSVKDVEDKFRRNH